MTFTPAQREALLGWLLEHDSGPQQERDDYELMIEEIEIILSEAEEGT